MAGVQIAALTLTDSVTLEEGHYSPLCLSFLVCKMGITLTPASGILTKVKFNALLYSRPTVRLDNSLVLS